MFVFAWPPFRVRLATPAILPRGARCLERDWSLAWRRMAEFVFQRGIFGMFEISKRRRDTRSSLGLHAEAGAAHSTKTIDQRQSAPSRARTGPAHAC
jgi:hypothetical protein